MFKNKTQEKVFKQVGDYLVKLFGEEYKYYDEGVPIYRGVEGSALINVVVYPWGDDDATVKVSSCCVMDIELVPDLLKFLLRESQGLRFGGFSIDDDGDIWFVHTIVGSNLSKEELAASVRAVSATADHYDDIITKKWGGMTGADKALSVKS